MRPPYGASRKLWIEQSEAPVDIRHQNRKRTEHGREDEKVRFTQRLSLPKAMEVIESIIQSNPAAAADFQPLIDLHKKKLWHELSEVLDKQLSHPALQKGDTLVRLYEFVKTFEERMNPLKLARFLVAASRQLPDAEAAAFIENGLARMRDNEGKIVLTARKIEMLLRSGDALAGKQLLEKTKQDLDALAMADPTVHSALYRVALDYYKKQGPASDYYKSGLSFLSYTPLEQLSPSEQASLSFELALAALLGDDVYNFGELLQSSAFLMLERCGYKWLGDVVAAFNRGDITLYNSIRSAHAADFQKIPSLIAGESILRQKLIILSLMEMVFARPAADRIFTFATIAQRLQLNVDEVEFCVMKALAQGLLRGTIDEVDRTVTITWVRSRVLDTTQIQAMRARLSEWSASVGQMVQLLHTETKELTA